MDLAFLPWSKSLAKAAEVLGQRSHFLGEATHWLFSGSFNTES